MIEFTEEDYKTKIKELEKQLKKYRIMHNKKNCEIMLLKEKLNVD